MIDHERARELASLASASDVDPADAEWLDDHLVACADCRGFAAELAAPAVGTQPARPPRARVDRAAILRQTRRPAFLVTVGALVVALVAGGLAWNGGRSNDSNVAVNQPSAPASALPGALGGADPWESAAPGATFQPLAGEAAVPLASLTARDATGSVVPLDTQFRLASVDATPASALASRLSVTPTFAFAIAPEADGRAAVLTPNEPLQAGVVYRFALRGTTGEAVDSWAFQAHQALRVIGTLPGDQTTDVPLDTGIEITFDQDGPTDAASHFTITPKTAGRFEDHDRTLVFVPDKPLAPATIYSVVLNPGITLANTGDATDRETRFRFETAAATTPTKVDTYDFPDDLVESATSERPVIGLTWYSQPDVDSEAEPPPHPKTTHLDVYRLADIDAAITVFRAQRARPDWSRWSTDGLADTSKLSQVVSAELALNENQGAFWVRLPKALPAGWYLVRQSGGARPIQAVLQVTNVSGYLSVSDSRTLVWANDIKTGLPIAGATASSDGTVIGRTDADGLVLGTTPASLVPVPAQTCDHPCDPVVTVRTQDGRAVFLPAALVRDKLESYGDVYLWAGDSSWRYWSLLHTDRDRYRPTDTVNIWGVLRDRDSGTVPSDITVRLTAGSYDDSNVRPPVATVKVGAAPSGAFSASIPVTDLPQGFYAVDVLVGADIVQSTGIAVGDITKPAYALAVETGHHVYIAGDRIKITTKANFFEGTPVPGVPLRIDGLVERSVTTGPDGTAVYRTTAKATVRQEGGQWTQVGVRPARSEEGDIAAANRGMLIYPSSRTIDATARISNGRVRVAGSVHLVDVDRLEAELANGEDFWSLDPRGTAVRGATVTVRFVELVPVRIPNGTRYDFIEKKVVQVFDERTRERAAGTIRVKTAANGTYTASVPATTKDHDYQVIVSVSDANGHVDRSSAYANRHPWAAWETHNATLHPTDPTSENATFGIGDRVDVTMGDPETKQSSGDGTRYLFYVAQRGIRSATVQSSPRFSTTFAEWAPPSLYIGAVRFTGQRYVRTVQFGARFRTDDRRLTVGLTPRAARYAPGANATIDVRTRDASGAPVAATVVLRAIDEKLFSIGAASLDDPLAELYVLVGSGVTGSYSSHRSPRGDQGGEGGDTTGGGDERAEFRDALLFKTIVTDSSGRGSVSFPVSDDLTSWRVIASAITAKLEAGSNSVLVPVGLPLFVDAAVAPEYLVADRPSIPLRVFGSALKAGDAVTINVTSTSLAFDSGPIRAEAFATTVVPLPALRLGDQAITITAISGSRTDRLTRTFRVVATRLTQTKSAYVELPSGAPLRGGPGLTKAVISDAGAGRYLPLLNDLASGRGARLDRGIAAAVASSLLTDRFGSTEIDPASRAFDGSRYQRDDGGMALLPYSSSDLELSALVAIVAPNSVDRGRLDGYLRNVRADVNETRERQMFALAGLAALGDPVLPAIQAAAADPNLTIREQLMIGLGAAAIGDTATARAITTGLITTYGEQQGQQARLRIGSSAASISSGTALMAVLAAELGDSRAPLFWAYVEANPEVDQLDVLQAVAYVSNKLDRLAVVPASFAYTLDGTRTEIKLDDGRAYELSLTAAQLAGLKVDVISGSIGVATSWREPIQAGTAKADPDLTLSRTVSPSTTIGDADLVSVFITVTFGPQAASGCHYVTDLVPSGLMPVGTLVGWVDPQNGDTTTVDAQIQPYDQTRSAVSFCADPSEHRGSVVLRYFARVVTPGTYAWEPAIAESRSQDGRVSLTAATEVVIR